MAVQFPDLSSQQGLKQLDEYLLTRSYITGYEGSRDDLAVYAALKDLPVPAEFVNISRWHSHIAALIGPRSVIFCCCCLVFVLLFLVSLSGVFQADGLFRTRFGSSR
jgi:hypothetical protein